MKLQGQFPSHGIRQWEKNTIVSSDRWRASPLPKKRWRFVKGHDKPRLMGVHLRFFSVLLELCLLTFLCVKKNGMREILHFHKCWIKSWDDPPSQHNPQTKNDINKSVPIHMSHEKDPLTFHYTGCFNNDP